jgi:DNA/RNA-binding domain of Phe-tRNA-synthetase-like protein
MLTLSESLAGRVCAHALWYDSVRVDEREDAYLELTQLAVRLRARHEGRSVGQVEGVAQARHLYRSFGIDPTRTRPSSEALLKRALQGKELYHLNNVVDAGNLASLSTLLPIGLYDRSKIVGENASIREGLSEEEYPGIRKGPVHLEGRLCIADDLGAFGSPTSDSLRTCVTGSTSTLLAVVFAPADCEPERVLSTAEALTNGFTRHAGARLVYEQSLVP